MKIAEKNSPAGWVRLPLEDVAEIYDNLREPVNSAERAKRLGSYPYYGATGQVGWIDDYRQDGEYVLLGEDGAPFFEPTKNKAYLVSGKCWVNNHAHVLKGREGLCSNRYLLYALNQTNYRGYANGTTRLKLTQAAMRQLPIDLAPFLEQHRIVAKIEELFSELDKGIENLKTARAQLKVYRQALLKHAFEGKLTAQWRAENPDKLETAAALLKRIQTERAERYQQQLAEWEKSKSPSIPLFQRGKSTSAATPSPAPPTNTSPSSIPIPPFEKGGLGGISKPKAPKPLPPLTAEELAELPELPEGWQEKNLGSLISFLTSGSRGWAQYYSNSGDTFIRAQNLKHDFLDLSEKAFVSLPERAEGLRTRVQIGDLLITITGANVTKSALVEHDMGVAYVSQHVALCRPTQEIMPKYLYWFIVAEAAGRKQLADAAYGAGKPGLNLENIRSVVVPLPPYSEQKKIVELIEEKLSVVDQLDQTITTALQQAEALRQSILKKAFSGQLVPQDPHDEPASALLARIKAEKATAKENLSVRHKGKRDYSCRQ